MAININTSGVNIHYRTDNNTPRSIHTVDLKVRLGKVSQKSSPSQSPAIHNSKVTEFFTKNSQASHYEVNSLHKIDNTKIMSLVS